MNSASWLFHEQDLKNEPKFFEFVQVQAKRHLFASFGHGFGISEHCVEAMGHDVVDGNIPRVYRVEDFAAFVKYGYEKDTCEVVEAELSQRDTDGKFLVTKTVLRVNGIKINGNNPVFVIRYNYDRFACIDRVTVITFWTNAADDLHDTLDLSKYCRDVHSLAEHLRLA